MKKFIKLTDYIAVQDKTLKYYYIYAPTHPMASAAGKIYLHRYLMAEKLGRYLTANEVVHHIDHDRTNNHIDNLELTTTVEHAITHMTEKFPKKTFACLRCGVEFRKYRAVNNKSYCSYECAQMDRRLFDIDKDELTKLMWELPTTRIAKIFNVSDVAIGKRCKLLGVGKPPRGYWAKQLSSQ